LQVHGDYSEDVGIKVYRPIDEVLTKADTELVDA